MRAIHGFMALMSLVMLCAVPAHAQMCGDIDNDGVVDIGDMVRIFEYGAGRTYPNMYYNRAEVDGRDYISFSDLSYMVDYLFVTFEPLVCNPPTLDYTFTPTLADTLFVPRILSIPENVQLIGLPVYSVCADTLKGFCVGFKGLGPGSSNNFRYKEYTEPPGWDHLLVNGVSLNYNTDSLLLYAFPVNHEELNGKDDWGTYWFERTAPGPASIMPKIFDQSQYWRTSVAKNGDLHIPVYVYYDYVIPPDTMQVTPSAANLTTYAYRMSKDSVAITYASAPNPVKFTLSATKSWVVYPTGVLTTPTTIYLRANADSLTAGAYSATLDVATVDPNATILPGPMTVDVTVLPPIEFPIGDFDCSGNIDVGDLTILIAYMFLGGTPPTPCY